MKFLNKIKSYLPSFLRNKWAISFIVLFLWVLIFEDVNLYSLYKTKSKISTLNKEWEFKENRIKQAEEKKALIIENPEKYAREIFWMKKSDEELFVIQKNEKK